MDDFDRKRPLVGLIKAINHHPRLTAQAKVVGVTMALAYLWDYGFVRLGNDHMRDRTGMPQRTINRALKNLIDCGVISRTRTGRTTIYKFTDAVKGSVIVDRPNRPNRSAKSAQRQNFDMSLEEWHCREDDGG